MAKKHTKRCTKSLVIRETQIIITMKYISHSLDSHNQNIITNVDEDAEKLEPSYTAGGNGKWYSHSAKQVAP